MSKMRLSATAAVGYLAGAIVIGLVVWFTTLDALLTAVLSIGFFVLALVGIMWRARRHS